LIGAIEARDADEDCVTYRWDNVTGSDYFNIGANSGLITVNKSLEALLTPGGGIKTLRMTVFATDCMDPQRSKSVVVDLMIHPAHTENITLPGECDLVFEIEIFITLRGEGVIFSRICFLRFFL